MLPLFLCWFLLLTLLQFSFCNSNSHHAQGTNFMDEASWHRFRDEVEDDRWHGWNLAKPFDQGLDPAKDPCRNVKCGRYKVCIAQAYRTAVCISRRHLAHSMKKLKESQKPISSMSVMTCKHCRVRTPSPVCGSDDHTYSSLCKLEFQACHSGKQINVRCYGACPCKPLSLRAQDGESDECGQWELNDMASRLKDWFRVLHQRSPESINPSSMPTNPADFDTSVLPICKDSVGWIFTRLDINRDLFLDQLELASVGLGHPGPGRGAAALDKYERCLAPFLRACDTYADGLLSNNEWCFCFQRQKPPCHVQRDQLEAEKRLMGYVPSCDADGFYQAQQCHQGTDQCWCVDPNGKEQPGSRVYGQADCGWDEAEGSGNEGSGDADDWTDDDDIAKGTAQAQVVGSKVEEAEPEDADDEDEGDDGYGW